MMATLQQWQLKLERPMIVGAYRLLASWVGSYKFLLLTTSGRKSGRAWTVPLVYATVDGGYAVVAANVGLDAYPGWYLNLKHNSQAQIQIGTHKMTVCAGDAEGAERERLWAEWVRVNPGYQGFQDKTARVLPIVILKPV